MWHGSTHSSLGPQHPAQLGMLGHVMLKETPPPAPHLTMLLLQELA